MKAMLPQRKVLNTMNKCSLFECILMAVISVWFITSIFFNSPPEAFNIFRYFAMIFVMYYALLYIIGNNKEEVTRG